jgi:hypothetical protein
LDVTYLSKDYHTINSKVISKLASAGSSVGMDTSFDVADVCSQEKKAQHADAEKSNKVMQCSFTL